MGGLWREGGRRKAKPRQVPALNEMNARNSPKTENKSRLSSALTDAQNAIGSMVQEKVGGPRAGSGAPVSAARRARGML